MKKVFLSFLVFASLSDIALSKDVGSASYNLERKNMPGSIDAKGARVDGDYKIEGTKVSGKFTVKLSDMKSGMDLLDKHTCEHLECDKYPTAVFAMDSFDMKDGEVKGTLTLHGKTVPVSGWKAKVSGQNVTVNGPAKLSDFDIKTPSYAGVGVADKVDLTVDVTI
jgi:polyisoprenoid-binding protein YceI